MRFSILVSSVFLNTLFMTTTYGADFPLSDGTLTISGSELPVRESPPSDMIGKKGKQIGTVSAGSRLLVLATRKYPILTGKVDIWAKVCVLKEDCATNSPCKSVGWVYAGPRSALSANQGNIKTVKDAAPGNGQVEPTSSGVVTPAQ